MTYERTGPDRPSSSGSETLDEVRQYLDHELEHVLIFPVMIKRFDRDCKICQILFDRIEKKSSQKHATASLEGKPIAIIQYTTILCAIGMHDECGKDYVMTNSKIESSCLCECHQTKPLEKNLKQKRRRRK